MSRLHCNSTATTVSSVQFLFSLCRRTQSAFSKISPVIPSVVVFKKPQQKKHLFCWAALYYTGLLYIVSPKYQPSLILMPGCVWFCFPLDSCITREPSRNTVIFYIISSLLLISCTKLNLRSVLLLFHTQTKRLCVYLNSALKNAFSQPQLQTFCLTFTSDIISYTFAFVLLINKPQLICISSFKLISQC